MRRSFLRRSAPSARFAQALAVFAAVLAVTCSVAFRYRIIQPVEWIVSLVIASGAAGVAFLFALRALWLLWREGAKGGKAAFAAIVICAAMAGPLVAAAIVGTQTPMLNDVSTDPDDPPQFPIGARINVAEPFVPPLAPDVARAAQRIAYPELVTRSYRLPPQRILRALDAAANELGWQVSTKTGQLTAPGTEARHAYLARTPVLRFEDDVVVRLRRPSNDETTVDVRSAGRFGSHDFGSNAARINRFFAVFEQLLRSLPGDEIEP